MDRSLEAEWRNTMSNKKLSPVGQVVKAIVMAIVDFPEDVEVSEVAGSASTVLEVSVRQSDHGKTVGRNGRLVDAIREILACHTGLEQHRYVLEILEGERHLSGPQSPFSSHPSHAEDAVMMTVALLTNILRGIVDDPNSVEVTPAVGIKVAVFEVKVAEGDNRSVIGKGGRTATALP